MPVIDETEWKAQVEELAGLYRNALNAGDANLAAESRAALSNLADGRAALSKAAIIAAFVKQSAE